MISKRQHGPQKHKLHVGDWVTLQFGGERVRGVILEDRGPIGARGRQIFFIEVPLKYDEPLRFEMPADDLEPATQGEK
jgi:hypothetical protein